MTTVYYDSQMTDDDRRSCLFAGDLFVYSKRKSVTEYVGFARELINEAFAGPDPELAQHQMAVEDYAALLGKLKPLFIHHPESKKHLQRILSDFGCDLERTYFDVPRMRSSTSSNYLTAGIAYAWHPHRDTWYSAPQCQINWWFPVYELMPENVMAFHQKYWNHSVQNNSKDYNYYEWNSKYRGPAVSGITKDDPRPLPRSTEALEMEPQLRLICPVGGMILFSGAHLHSSVPNTSGRTRFSIDFRTVHFEDADRMAGAPRSDEECTGTTIRDYLRGNDFERLPENIVMQYEDGTAAKGVLIYDPQAAD